MKSGQAGLSGAKQGQTGPNGANWCQTGSNGAKWGQTGTKMAKKCLTGPNVAKRANGAKQGQMGSYGADFFATQAVRQKLPVGRISCTCQRNFFLYHLKPYLNGFILSHDSKFLGAPFMA